MGSGAKECADSCAVDCGRGVRGCCGGCCGGDYSAYSAYLVVSDRREVSVVCLLRTVWPTCLVYRSRRTMNSFLLLACVFDRTGLSFSVSVLLLGFPTYRAVLCDRLPYPVRVSFVQLCRAVWNLLALLGAVTFEVPKKLLHRWTWWDWVLRVLFPGVT